jgi:DNA-binding CsgD family transcriptional regulator
MAARSTRSLVGRDEELERAWPVLTAGMGIVVLEGAPGVGKTSVFDSLVRRLEVDRVVPCACAVEAEAELSYAAFADLANPLYDLAASSLPDAQRTALDAALLRGSGGQAIELRAVATAFLTLLREVASCRSVTLAVDDVQWLDAASAAAIGYALRRLDDERCSVLVSVRSGHPAHLIDRLHEASPVETVSLSGLTVQHTRALLAQTLDAPISAITATRIHALSEGNPLLSLELARAQNGDRDPAAMLALPKRLEELHAARISALPARVRRLALHVAAHGRPTAASLERALLSPTTSIDLAAASTAGVLVADAEVRFTHPLLGAAAYGIATDAEQRRAHRAWAAVVNGAEERARHLAKSSARSNEQAAAACERGAIEARSRGSAVAAAELAALSRGLTPANRRADRARRGRLAVELVFAAGDLPEARRLIDQLLGETAEPSERSRLSTLEGRILIFERDRDERVAGLVEALASAGDDARAAADAHIQLAELNMSGPGANVLHGRMAVRLLEDLPGEERMLVRAILALVQARRVHEAVIDLGLLDRAQSLERRFGRSTVYEGVDLLRACAEVDMGRYDEALGRFHALVTDCEERGEVVVLPELQVHLAATYWYAGRLTEAQFHAERCCRLGDELGEPYTAGLGRLAMLCIHATRDANDPDLAELEDMAALFGSRPGSWAAAPAHTVLGHVAVVRERWDEAVSHLDIAADACERHGINNWSFQFEGDHVEALLAAGRREDAWRRMERLTMQATRPHAVWPAMAGLRCRALLLAAEGRTIEARAEVREARAVAERLSPLEVGRCLLVEGAVERRAKQKRAARETFAAARDVFEEIGASAWGKRAAREATRVGGRAPAQDDLTTTERRVVDLAVDGLRNREIAAAMFISEHTVESNLTRAYRKLGVRSRTQLSRSVDAATR